MPVFLHGCEIWSLTLRAERRLRVFENRVQRKIFEPKMDEVTGEWRNLHNEEQLYGLYYSPNIVRVIKSRRGRWAGGDGVLWHGKCVGKERCIEFWWGNVMERDHLKEAGLDERIILNLFFKKWDGGMD